MRLKFTKKTESFTDLPHQMSPTSLPLSWTREEVDGRLKDIMTNIFNTAKTTAETYGLGTDYLAGANIAAFETVANAMIAQGIV